MALEASPRRAATERSRRMAARDPTVTSTTIDGRADEVPTLSAEQEIRADLDASKSAMKRVGISHGWALFIDDDLELHLHRLVRLDLDHHGLSFVAVLAYGELPGACLDTFERESTVL